MAAVLFWVLLIAGVAATLAVLVVAPSLIGTQTTITRGSCNER